MSVEGAAVAPTPDAVAPPPGNPRFPLLDGLRAIAAMLVLLFHVATATGKAPRAVRDLSQEGIAIFFVLSGFLLYRPFVRARLSGRGVPSVRAYAWRRALRIMPAYWLALTFALTVAGGTLISTHHLPVYYLLLQDYVGSARYSGLAVAWTLSIEATYYAVLPLLALLAVGLARRSRWQLAPEAAIVAGLALITAAVHLLRPSAPDTILSYADWFAAGMLLAMLSLAYGSRSLSRMAAAGMWLGATAVIVLEIQVTGHYARHFLWIISATMFVIPAVFPAAGGPVTAFLERRVLLSLGLISYGIYLWHLPVIAIIEKVHRIAFTPLLAITLPTTVAVAALSYGLLEAPLLRLKDR